MTKGQVLLEFALDYFHKYCPETAIYAESREWTDSDYDDAYDEAYEIARENRNG